MAKGKTITLTEEQMLALKAVAYGCNKNKKLIGSTFVSDIHSAKPQEISFYDALMVIYEMIDKLDSDEEQNET